MKPINVTLNIEEFNKLFPFHAELELENARLREALENLIYWLDADTMEIMKDTIKMGLTFDWKDCGLLREQIEKARLALGSPMEGERKNG